MKKTIALLLSALLLVSLAACGGDAASNPDTEQPSTDAAEPNSGEAVVGGDELDVEEVPPEEAPEDPAVQLFFSNDDVEMLVECWKPSYTLDEFVDVTITITNKGDSTLMFAKGSGANDIPDALQVDLGGFNPLYKPSIATMDMQMDTLEPEQRLVYETPFAPYIPNGEQPTLGTDLEIDFFKDGDFTPAESGEASGTITFSYMPIPEDAAANEQFASFAEEDLLRLTGDFGVTIA